MEMHLIMVRRGAKRLPQDKAAILAGKAPVLTGDNLRFDINGETVPGGLPIDPSEVMWSFYYGDSPAPDLTFPGSQEAELEGDHFKIGGIGAANLDRSNGCTVNVKLHAGSPGRTTARVVAECRGASAEVKLPFVD